MQRKRKKQLALGLNNPCPVDQLTLEQLESYWPLTSLSQQMQFKECVASDLFFAVFKLEIKAHLWGKHARHTQTEFNRHTF